MPETRTGWRTSGRPLWRATTSDRIVMLDPEGNRFGLFDPCRGKDRIDGSGQPDDGNRRSGRRGVQLAFLDSSLPLKQPPRASLLELVPPIRGPRRLPKRLGPEVAVTLLRRQAVTLTLTPSRHNPDRPFLVGSRLGQAGWRARGSTGPEGASVSDRYPKGRDRLRARPPQAIERGPQGNAPERQPGRRQGSRRRSRNVRRPVGVPPTGCISRPNG